MPQDRLSMRLHNPSSQTQQRGFTLVELIMVIVIMGVIGGVVAVFMRSPIDAYFDSARRAALTDVADTAVRRMARDLRKALPNSIRVEALTPNCLEFIPTRTGGRYRTTDLDGVAGSALDFTAADTKFNMLGKNSLLPADQQIRPGDVVAVYNLGITDADAYTEDNTAVIVPNGVVDGDETTITIASKKFPLESGSNRFHVIPKEEQVVAYVCTGGNLHRTVRTDSFTRGCPATGPILATNAACTFNYNGSDLQRNGLVQIDLRISSNNETISLYHEVHVNNSP
jgi:MSHA biogenesis protein MshO